MPAVDEVFLSSVDTHADLAVIGVLSRLVRERHAAAEQPFSPDVYFYADSTYYRVGFDPDGTAVFPGELASRLAALG